MAQIGILGLDVGYPMFLFFKSQICKQPLAAPECSVPESGGVGERSPSLARNIASLVRLRHATFGCQVRWGGGPSGSPHDAMGDRGRRRFERYSELDRWFLSSLHRGLCHGRGISPCDGGLVMRKE